MKNETKVDEKQIENKLLDNPMYGSLVGYFKYKAPGGRLGKVRFTKEDSTVICTMKYGKARLYIDAYIDENGAITAMVFDFRDIFDKYVAKKTVEKHGDDYVDYVYDVLRQAKFEPQYVCLLNNYKGGIQGDEELYETFGISLVGYKNENFNLFTPWAGVLNEVLNALDAVNGFAGDDKKNKLTRKDVDDAAVKYPLMFWVIILLGYLAIIGGIVLIVVNKTWAPFLKWLVGIVLVIGGLLFGPLEHFFSRSNTKDYYKNSGDIMKKFHKPEKKRFITIGE